MRGRYLTPHPRNKKSTKKGNEKQWSKNNDYLSVVLYLKGELKGKMKLVHRLVAETYIPNPDNLPEVNHKDGNKRNNHVSNLEWTTRSGNAIHSWINGLQSTGHKRFTPNEIRFIREQYGIVSRTELGKRFGVSPKTITSIQKRYTYKYVK